MWSIRKPETSGHLPPDFSNVTGAASADLHYFQNFSRVCHTQRLMEKLVWPSRMVKDAPWSAQLEQHGVCVDKNSQASDADCSWIGQSHQV